MGLDFVELVMAVEEKFGIEMEEPDAERFMTVGGMFDYVLEKLNAQDKIGWDDDQWTKERLWIELGELIQDQLGVGVEMIQREKHFVKDLNID